MDPVLAWQVDSPAHLRSITLGATHK